MSAAERQRNVPMATKARNAVHLVPREQISVHDLPTHTYRALCGARMHALPFSDESPVTCTECQLKDRAEVSR